MAVVVGEECFTGGRKSIPQCVCVQRVWFDAWEQNPKRCSCKWMKAQRSLGNHTQGWDGLVGQVKTKWEKMKKQSSVCVCVWLWRACCGCAWRATDCACNRVLETARLEASTSSSFFRGGKYGYVSVRSCKCSTAYEMKDLLILGN